MAYIKSSYQSLIFTLLVSILGAILYVGCGAEHKDAEAYMSSVKAAIPQKEVLSAEECVNYIDKFVKTKGVVASVYQSKDTEDAPLFININRPFPENPLVLIIFKEDSHLFPQGDFFVGKTITVEGKVTNYEYNQGIKPSIKLHNTNQIVFQ